MAKATKTIRQSLGYEPQHAKWLRSTKDLFNQVAAFYFEVITAHPGVLDLDTKATLTALEKLTHTTKENPHPVMPLSEAVAADVPAMFRRAAIHAALGPARSFMSNLSKWHRRKEKAVTRGKKFSIRPPVPPRSWNRSVTLYAGQWKGRTPKSIMLKLWTSSSWAWVKCRIQGRVIPAEWDVESPTLVQDGKQWRLHTAVQKKFSTPCKVEQQITTHPETRLCSVDLNMTKHLAVCTVQTVEGTVLATRFIDGGKHLHGLRKRQLGRSARNRSKTGIIARYDARYPAEGYTPGAPLVYCPQCQMHGNADRNAAIVIGKRLLARHQQTHSQEKPHAPLHVERPVKTGGVRRSQVAKRRNRLSTDPARHGTANAQGTAQDTLKRMVESVAGIAHQLRLFKE